MPGNAKEGEEEHDECSLDVGERSRVGGGQAVEAGTRRRGWGEWGGRCGGISGRDDDGDRNDEDDEDDDDDESS